MTTTPEFCVLYSDMLGFKSLVREYRVPYHENLEFRGRLINWPERENPATSSGNPLSRAFRAFHHSTNQALGLTTWNSPVSLVVFSDSLFLATTNAMDCVSFAQQLMVLTLNRDTPLRMGIGQGSFVPYGFSYEESPHIKITSSQFFGSGVVNAVEAEKTLKGMRIAVHPSAVEIIRQVKPRQLLPVPTEEAGIDAKHELSYVPDHPDPMGDLQYGPEIIKKIRRLGQSASEDSSVQVHYGRSTAALERMIATLDDQ